MNEALPVNDKGFQTIKPWTFQTTRPSQTFQTIKPWTFQTTRPSQTFQTIKPWSTLKPFPTISSWTHPTITFKPWTIPGVGRK